ncbi:MAG: EamA family transporter [Candidatus Rokubacteria bacterium]|nr:EamA family transporter [Candidatus Rokubacteria bacterium]
MVKTFVLVLIAAVLGGTGHVMLATGMKTIGDLTEAPSHRVGGMVGRTLSNPWVLLGVLLQATFFAMYLTLLSRDDVSKILPMMAIDYIVVVLLAQVVLGEAITPGRWLGVGLIVAGVTMVSRS